MQAAGMRKELEALKKEVAPSFKTIEELLKCDPHSLTNEEIFRVIQHYHPELKTEEDLTSEILNEMCQPTADKWGFDDINGYHEAQRLFMQDQKLYHLSSVELAAEFHKYLKSERGKEGGQY